MCSFRDSVVSWRARGCPLVVSTLTNSEPFSSPSLSSSIISVSGSDGESTRCGRRTVGLAVRVGAGTGAGDRRAFVVETWLGVCSGGKGGSVLFVMELLLFGVGVAFLLADQELAQVRCQARCGSGPQDCS